MTAWLIAGYAFSLCAGAGFAYVTERGSLRRAAQLFNEAADSYTAARRLVERRRGPVDHA